MLSFVKSLSAVAWFRILIAVGIIGVISYTGIKIYSSPFEVKTEEELTEYVKDSVFLEEEKYKQAYDGDVLKDPDVKMNYALFTMFGDICVGESTGDFKDFDVAWGSYIFRDSKLVVTDEGAIKPSPLLGSNRFKIRDENCVIINGIRYVRGSEKLFDAWLDFSYTFDEGM